MNNIIPIPMVWEPKDGKFVLSCDNESNHPMVKSALARLPKGAKGRIVAQKTDDGLMDKEGYAMTIAATEIVIKYQTDAGLFYALQTLRVLAEVDIKQKAEYAVACGKIVDEPRYGWRGLLLDEARHFFGKDAVKRLLDRMAVAKLNVLHWHLNDDQGWRVHIDKYPLLTEIGSVRKETQIGGWTSPKRDGKVHKGFYTKADIKEILDYAALRFITVVPEIDFPGHFTAAISAYPHLSCNGEATEVSTTFGIKKQIACGGKDEVYTFLTDVLDEISDLFSSPYIHIGGDEAPKDEWKKCKLCQAKIAELGLADEEDLQGYMTNQVIAFLQKKGKTVVAWNEVLAAKSVDAAVVSEYWTPWRDPRAEQFLKDGGKTVIARQPVFYFDYPYAMTPLKKTYNFDKALSYLPLDDEAVLGIEGAAWAEWIDTESKLDFQLYPRLYALAECAWSKQNRDYSDFMRRLKAFLPIADAMGVGYADLSIVNIKNPLTRAIRVSKWGISDQNVEYKISKKRRKQV